MIVRKISFFIFGLILCLSSCKKDDNSNDFEVVPPRDRGEQQIVDDAAIQDYLESHYYNASAFVANADPSISDLIISELPSDGIVPDEGNNVLLSNAVETLDVVFAETDYIIYILRLNQGGGYNSPKFPDQISVLYEGFLLDGTVFDSAVNPVPFYLVGNGDNIGGVVPGWRKVMPEFNVAESFIANGDGTDNFISPGVGVMFLPSGLAYFSNSPSTEIPSYSPLVFKFELLSMIEIDFDNDGIPNYLEELTGDGEFTVVADTTVADDDTDGDNFPNLVDPDDDGDGILTKNEITLTIYNKSSIEEITSIVLESNQVLLNSIVEEQNGTFTGKVITFTDTDGDGKADYLDAN